MGTEKIILRDVRHGGPRSRLRLLAPLRYLRIHHPEKTLYDFVIPFGSGLAAWLVYRILFPDLAIFSDAGLVKYTRDLLIMAVPFMVGALATVAMGFPGQHIDRRPPGAELVLDGRVLTLRQFVCYLLGYLCLVALVTLMASIVAPLLQPSVARILVGAPLWKWAVHSLGTLVLFELLSILIITTLWALYFLTDIVNRPAAERD